MSKNKITFATLEVKKRKVLLTALDFDMTNLKCELCNNKTTKDMCCIMPSLKKTNNATILCDSTLCMSEYISKIENKCNTCGNILKEEYDDVLLEHFYYCTKCKQYRN